MPLIGYWLVELITILVDSEAGAQAGKIMSLIVTWIAFALLLFIGGKMLIEGILDLKKDEEEKEVKLFSYKEVLLFGVATSIDALATGVAFHAGISNNITIWLHVVIIMCITFVISFAGVVIAKQVQKLLKGKYEITAIIGGIILLSLAVWIVLSHYLGI
jgi:putative Mn2+ efflux pump MntP